MEAVEKINRALMEFATEKDLIPKDRPDNFCFAVAAVWLADVWRAATKKEKFPWVAIGEWVDQITDEFMDQFRNVYGEIAQLYEKLENKGEKYE